MKYNVKVLNNETIAEGMSILTVEAIEIANMAYPGQFVHIKIPYDNSLIMRRPISINSVNREKGTVDLVFQKVGKGTRILSKVEKGDVLDMLGPLGKGFMIPQGSRSIYLIGGGCGVAPLRFAVERWTNLRVVSFLGFRNMASAYHTEIFKRCSNELYISTDDGSMGEKGLITELVQLKLKADKPDLILSCGPSPMLRAVQVISGNNKIPCQVSLEGRMGCGIGSCLVCACAVISADGWKYKKVCKDGPVFWSEEVILDGKPGNGC